MYGFAANPSLTVLQNAVIAYGETLLDKHHSRPKNLAFHDLTAGRVMPRACKSVLGLSYKFVPTPIKTWADVGPSLARFDRDTQLKVFFAGDPMENVAPPLRLKSTWRPPATAIPCEVDSRIAEFSRGIRKLYQERSGISNLLPFQRRTLFELKNLKDLIIVKSDKGLGPCAIEFERYVRGALAHLTNPDNYQMLTEAEAQQMAQATVKDIYGWISKNRKYIDDDSAAYIRKKTRENAEDPFGVFYVMLKIHKMGESYEGPLKTRPVVSDCASAIHPIGKWVDLMLKPFTTDKPSYLRDSFQLKEILSRTRVSRRARIFSCDAVAMYVNIPTDSAMAIISKYLREADTKNRYDHYDAETLISALEIVMRNNIIKFGDVYVKQISGTAMGVPPAPSWANLYEALDENEFLPTWQTRLLLYKRYLDDIIGVWEPNSADESTDAAEWTAFKERVNSIDGLTWEFTERVTTVDFMDMTVSIAGDRLRTTLFEKNLALYLYIPPNSAHPPGILTGHVYGEVLRIHRLCMDEDDIANRVKIFYDRLIARGHTSSSLLPLFKKALANARKFLTTSEEERLALKQAKHEESKRQLYFHVEYHPQGPTSNEVQKLFNNTFLRPPGKKPFQQIGKYGAEIPVDKLIVCHHRPLNLENHLSYRKICKRKGPPVSSFLKNE